MKTPGPLPGSAALHHGHRKARGGSYISVWLLYIKYEIQSKNTLF